MSQYSQIQQFAYARKAGKLPPKEQPLKEKHQGNWNLEYLGKILEYNQPYSVCMAKKKEYGMFGSYNKKKFKITPCKK